MAGKSFCDLCGDASTNVTHSQFYYHDDYGRVWAHDACAENEGLPAADYWNNTAWGGVVARAHGRTD